MRRQLFKTIIVVIVTLSITTTALADIKLKLKRTEDKRSSEEILYFKGARERHEFSGTTPKGKPYSGVWILQCDQKQLIGVSDLTKTYFSHSLQGGLLSGAIFAFN
jgi:hypothetical protein